MAELLRAAPARLRRLLIADNREFPELEARAREAGVTPERVEREQLDEWVGPGLARGILAVAAPPREWDLGELLERADGPRTRRGHRLVVVLDGVQDPHNLGAVLRSAEFFGAEGVVWARDRAAPLSPAAVRASVGASERLALARVTNLARALEDAKQAGPWWVIGTVVDGGRPLTELAADPPAATLLVLGGEQRGLRRLTRERCDFLATIERAGELGSLNVSAAAAVALAALG